MIANIQYNDNSRVWPVSVEREMTDSDIHKVTVESFAEIRPGTTANDVVCSYCGHRLVIEVL